MRGGSGAGAAGYTLLPRNPHAGVLELAPRVGLQGEGSALNALDPCSLNRATLSIMERRRWRRERRVRQGKAEKPFERLDTAAPRKVWLW